MNLGVWFSRWPRPIADRVYPVLRYANLMRAVEMSHLAPWIGEVRGWRVLDVGCGHGLYSLGFARRDADLLGCDLSASDLGAAHETATGMGLDGKAGFAMADAAALPEIGRAHV